MTQLAIAAFLPQTTAGLSIDASSPDGFAAAMQAQDISAIGPVLGQTQSIPSSPSSSNTQGPPDLSYSQPASPTSMQSPAKSAVTTVGSIQPPTDYKGTEDTHSVSVSTDVTTNEQSGDKPRTDLVPAAATNILNAASQQARQSGSPSHATAVNLELKPLRCSIQDMVTRAPARDASEGSDIEPQPSQSVTETLNTAVSKTGLPASADTLRPVTQQKNPLPEASNDVHVPEQADTGVPTAQGGHAGRGTMVKAHTAVRKAAGLAALTTEAKAPAAVYATFMLVEVPSATVASIQDKPFSADAAPRPFDGRSSQVLAASVLSNGSAAASPKVVASPASAPIEFAMREATAAIGMTQDPATTCKEDDHAAEPTWTGVHALSERGLDVTTPIAMATHLGHGVSFTHSMGASFGSAHSALTHADILSAVDGSHSADMDGAAQTVTRPLQRLDIAIDDPALGALNVRAELRNGTLHASLSGVTESLSNSAPALQQFLQEHRVGLHSVSFSQGAENAGRSLASASAVSDSAMTFGGDRGSPSDRQSEHPPRRSEMGKRYLTDDPRLSPVPQQSSASTYQPAGGFYNSSSSSSVSIHI